MASNLTLFLNIPTQTAGTSISYRSRSGRTAGKSKTADATNAAWPLPRNWNGSTDCIPPKGEGGRKGKGSSPPITRGAT